jgi:hypothetical protein
MSRQRLRRSKIAAAVMLLAAYSGSSASLAQGSRSASDAQIIAQAELIASGDHVEIYQHGVTVDAAFLRVAENAYRRLGQLTGRELDTRTLGPKIRIYVSSAITISHVWKGYDHPTEPRGIVYLNPRVYLAGLNGSNATYVHEMAHLFTWRFHSHTLREGLADYLALQVHPGAAVGPNQGGDQFPTRISPEIAGYLGTRRPPPPWLTSDAARRRAYYLAGYRLVRFLVETAGMDVFMKLYDSDSTETELVNLYGASRDELVRRAGM